MASRSGQGQRRLDLSIGGGEASRPYGGLASLSGSLGWGGPGHGSPVGGGQVLPTDGATARPVGPRDDESCVQHGGRTPLQMGVVWRKCGFILGQPWMGIGEHPLMGIGEEEDDRVGPTCL